MGLLVLIKQQYVRPFRGYFLTMFAKLPPYLNNHPEFRMWQRCFQYPKITGTRVALTASPSSTIVEECIAILRKLHQQQQQQRALQQQPAPPIGSGTNYIGGWGQKINEYMCLKLSLVNEIVAEIPLLQMQLPNETDGNT